MIERRRSLYCGGKASIDVTRRTTLVVDDRVATGTTLQAALAALRRSGAAWLVPAVQVIAPDTEQDFRAGDIEVVSVLEPEHFMVVGQIYQDFHQLKDDDVIALLSSGRTER